jgi:hypothetical protein
MTRHPLEHRARRAARRLGLVTRKSHRRRQDSDHCGGFMLLNEQHDPHVVVGGARYDMTAQQIIDFCRRLAAEEEAGDE